MATELYVPKMSDHMEEAVFVEWLVQEGDHVEAGQPVLVVDTDKVSAEVEAPATGWIKGMRAGLAEDVVLAVGETIAFIAETADEIVPVLDPVGSGSVEPVAVATPSRSEPAPPTPAPRVTPAPTPAPGGVAATPVARRVARELGIELSSVVGTGPGGRITEVDVWNHSYAGGGA